MAEEETDSPDDAVDASTDAPTEDHELVLATARRIIERDAAILHRLGTI